MSRTKNDDVVVDLALNYMCARGWIDAELVDDDLEGALRRHYRADDTGFIRTREPIRFAGEILHDMCAARPGECLAHVWESEQIQAYARALPIWRCDRGSEFRCGRTRGRRPGPTTALPDRRGLHTLGALVGTIRGKGSGADRNDKCPDCARRPGGLRGKP